MSLPYPLQPMLAQTGDEPFDSPDTLFEIKWDGYRALLYREEKIRLLSRSSKDLTPYFPEITALPLPPGPALLDGEIVVFRNGLPSFQAIQGRLGMAPKQDLPATFIPFDLLVHRDSLLKQPLHQRRQALEEYLAGTLPLSMGVVGSGLEFYQVTLAQGLEGMMAKDLKSPYLPGKRSSHWLKFRHTRQIQALIVGYTPSKGGRLLGSLLLTDLDQRTYLGRVGTGMNEATQMKILAKLQQGQPPFPIKEPGAIFVQPTQRCLVEYLEQTDDGRLRHPVFKRLL